MNESSSQTSHKWLPAASRTLRDADIATTRLDCLVLLEDVTGKDRAWLLSHPEYELQRSEIKVLSTKIAQRALHIPLAYIRGKAEFYGREFIVNEHTLVPRPETETMIDVIKSLTLPELPKMLDVGTGSGCIAITCARELPRAQMSACDIDPECIRVTKLNAESLQTVIHCFLSDLLENANEQYDVVLANLPYVPESHTINKAAMQEPKHAIFGGSDGLRLYRKLFKQLNKRPVEYVLTESLPPQHKELSHIAMQNGYKLLRTSDFIQLGKLV